MPVHHSLFHSGITYDNGTNPMKAALVAMVLLLLSAGTLGAVQLPSAGTTDGLGVNIAWDDYQSPNIDGIMSAGTKAVRVFMDWGNVEVTQGAYNFDHFDEVVNAYAAHGVRVMFSMTGGNNSLYGSDYTSQAWQTGFTKFAAATASHYKGDNCLYELWNEPDQPAICRRTRTWRSSNGRAGDAPGGSQLHDHGSQCWLDERLAVGPRSRLHDDLHSRWFTQPCRRV